MTDPKSHDFSGFQSSVCKKTRLSANSNDQEGDVSSSGESSPLGLTLSKTPSFLNLVEMKLSQSSSKSSSSTDHQTHHASARSNFRQKTDDFASQSEKLKASNFPALLLQIGSWERISRHEGDLVAKCYYAKKKIVWEVLEGALKSKIEIQWLDIEAIRATTCDDQPGILEIELNQPPQFFRETNPQPRKHTLWHPATDFTGGQAPICRRHYVRFPPGTLDKHFEKLLQCDHRLFELSQRPFPRMESPYFYSNMFGVTDISFDPFRTHQSPQLPPHGSLHPSFFPFPSSSLLVPPHPVHNLKLNTTQTIGIVDSNSPMSVMDFPQRYENVNSYPFENQRAAAEAAAAHWGAAEGNNVVENYCARGEDQIQGILPPSIVTSSTQGGGAPFSYQVTDPINSLNLDEIKNHLLGDTSSVSNCSDEGRLLARVRSMYSLLEQPLEESHFPTYFGANQLVYEQDTFVDGNSILGTNERFEIDGDVPCVQPIRCLPPPLVADENSTLSHLPMESYQYSQFVDPMVGDYGGGGGGGGEDEWNMNQQH